jgi:hypothetical protein
MQQQPQQQMQQQPQMEMQQPQPQMQQQPQQQMQQGVSQIPGLEELGGTPIEDLGHMPIPPPVEHQLAPPPTKSDGNHGGSILAQAEAMQRERTRSSKPDQQQQM